jgi:hypothetical protein
MQRWDAVWNVFRYGRAATLLALSGVVVIAVLGKLRAL